MLFQNSGKGHDVGQGRPDQVRLLEGDRAEHARFFLDLAHGTVKADLVCNKLGYVIAQAEYPFRVSVPVEHGPVFPLGVQIAAPSVMFADGRGKKHSRIGEALSGDLHADISVVLVHGDVVGLSHKILVYMGKLFGVMPVYVGIVAVHSGGNDIKIAGIFQQVPGFFKMLHRALNL